MNKTLNFFLQSQLIYVLTTKDREKVLKVKWVWVNFNIFEVGEATQNSCSSPIVLFNIGTSSSKPQWPTDVMSLLSLSHTTMPYIFHIPTNFVMDISLMVYRDLCWEDKLFHWLFCSGDNKKFPPQFRLADHPLRDYLHRSIILMFWAKRLATSHSTGGNKWCRLLLHSLSSYPLICCFTGLVSFITSYM